eukprot:7006432-Pyramimonas_sp.AAC.2
MHLLLKPVTSTTYMTICRLAIDSKHYTTPIAKLRDLGGDGAREAGGAPEAQIRQAGEGAELGGDGA